MADWTYQIIDQSGKERKGNIVAESEAEAKNKLKMDGNMVISLTKATALTKEISFSVGGKVKPRDLSVFCRQFTSMVNAGVTILIRWICYPIRLRIRLWRKLSEVFMPRFKKVRLSRMVSKIPECFP